MGKVILVGGSRGIGRAIIDDLISDHEIINISRTKPELNNEKLTHFECDVLKDELPDIENADSLIYCPGSINLKPINRFEISDFRDDFEINVIGAVRVIQKYLPKLKKGSNPSIILFSTVACKLGMPFHASVATAKSGVEGLMKSLAAELAPTVRVNAIAPTVTDTDLASGILRNDKMKEKMRERHPLKTYLEPKDVANMAAYLISNKASALTGQVFELDCGIVSLKI